LGSNSSQIVLKSPMVQQTKHFFDFDGFRVDATERLLLRDGEIVSLTQKAFDVLLNLIERRGQIVEKEELMRQVWAGSFVEEGNLTQNIYTLRKALGKTPDGDEYIKTLPRRGYRFAVQVNESWQESHIDNELPDILSVDDVQKIEGANEITKNELTTVAVINEASVKETPLPESKDEKQSNQVKQGKKIAVAFAVLLLLVLAGLAFTVYKLAAQNPTETGQSNGTQKMTITNLTTTGNIQRAAISPDGKYMVYAVADKPDMSSLWISQLATFTNQQIILPSGVQYHAISFSRDGEYIYYVIIENGQRLRTLYRIPLLGGTAKKLIEAVDTAVSFSPDGKEFVFRRWLDDRREAALFIADADGNIKRELASIAVPESFSDPVWSPDGKTIACAAGHNAGGFNMYVVTVNVADGTVKQLSNERWRWIGQMAWLADSSALIMVGTEGPATPYQIWQISSATGKVRKITNDSNFYNRLSMSTDGRAIIALQRKQSTNMWMVSRDDPSNIKQVTFGTGGYRGRVSWMPDDKIVFDSEAGNATSLSVMSSDGSNPKQLLGDQTGQAVVGYVTATPDGRYILYTSDITGSRQVWRINSDGSNAIQLTNGDSADHPTCSPDGRWVIYTRNEKDHPKLWRVSIDGGEAMRLTDGFTHFSTISPDGKLIACFYSAPGDPTGKIAILPITGGVPLKVFPNKTESSSMLCWMRDGRSLSYSENLPGSSKIWIQSIEGGEPKQFVEFESDRIFGFDWSNDGKRLICVRGMWTSNAVLVKDFR
jgi:Tol biopolymer transport system component/DNA-binding winged helix-turn-helix (wHTH) protein